MNIQRYHLRIIFEVSDMDNVSPATVSRCGMVFVDENSLNY